MSLSFSDAVKAKQLREYFNRYGRIYIVVDATRDEVVLPDNLKGDPALRLVLNMRMPQQIHIRDDRLDSDFSFSGRIFSCRIPMHTIWAAYQPEGELEQGIIWDESVPEVIRTIVDALQENMPDEEGGDTGSVAAEHGSSASMTVIEGGNTPTGETPKERKTSHLRVVK
ncbi:hypothetical protein FE236_03165 [Mariprofundus erugo]|uniref:ClpXP protease specificity-enhancing factor SspB n=1 Tax=Mariprofundus erugo TaxID=2528639 RepID=UPI0010FE39E1|nr:ClpXP protease specificity-enhancing factor SspB [Mariprofundus erugo]TLS77617.1 hypothetical protein FE236_03165 [Mariprofundus erugo]